MIPLYVITLQVLVHCELIKTMQVRTMHAGVVTGNFFKCLSHKQPILLSFKLEVCCFYIELIYI